MGQPAARIGDTTAHGGTIAAGAPTVMIGGMPAARMGDMHVCPMLNPGVPPPPHVGGPIAKGSAGVLICGMPAARVGDMAVCAGPPDSIVMGCMTVLIGETGAAGGGGGGPAGSDAANDAGGSGDGGSGKGEDKEPETVKSHFFHASFKDSGGFPIAGPSYSLKTPDGKEHIGMLNGHIKMDDVTTGDFKISLRTIFAARWSATQAKVGDKVKLTAKAPGIEAGSEAQILVYQKNRNAPNQLLTTLDTKVSGEKIEAEWSLAVDDKLLELHAKTLDKGGLPTPHYFFIVMSKNCSARSDLIEFSDWMEIELTAEDGSALKDCHYRLRLASGELRTGNLDAGGKAKIEDLPPGKVSVAFENWP